MQRNDHVITGVQSDLMQIRFHAFDLLVVSERKQSSTFAFVANSLTICPPVLKTRARSGEKYSVFIPTVFLTSADKHISSLTISAVQILRQTNLALVSHGVSSLKENDAFYER